MKIRNVEHFKVVSRDSMGYIGLILNKGNKKLYCDQNFLTIQESKDLYKGMNILECDGYLMVGINSIGNQLLIKLGDNDMRVYQYVEQHGCIIDNETGEIIAELRKTLAFGYYDGVVDCQVYIVTKHPYTV